MDRVKKIIKASFIGIAMNVALVIFKSLIGFFTNSIAVILDAVNNLTDVISAVVTIIGTKLSTKKPDKEHPYGHGRIEYVASIIISFIILMAGFAAVKQSIDKIIKPLDTNHTIIGLTIIFITILTKLIFSIYAKKVGKECNSDALKATSKDALMDVFLTLTTFIAGIINIIWKINIEGYLGLLISIFILKSAIEIIFETKDGIIGKRFDKEFTDKIKKAIKNNDKVEGVYDLILHSYGPSNIIGTANIEVKHDMTAEEIHKLTRKITIDIYKKYNIIMTIGIYAINENDEYKEIKGEINRIINTYECVKQIHGFYVDEKEKEIYFDMIIDFEEKNPEQIRKEVIKKLSDKFDEYKYNVIIDTDFSD